MKKRFSLGWKPFHYALFYTVLWCVSLVGFVLINIHSPTLIFIAESNVCGGFSLWPVNLINPL